MNKTTALLLFSCLPLLLGNTALRDPTEPPDYKGKISTQAASPFVLTGIFIYPEHALAIINNQTMTVGSQLGQYTITRINQDTVELSGPQNSKEVLQLLTAVKRAR